MAEPDDFHGVYLAPGTRVCRRGSEEGGCEYGIVVHCWLDAEIEAYDCYVAFFWRSVPN